MPRRLRNWTPGHAPGLARDLDEAPGLARDLDAELLAASKAAHKSVKVAAAAAAVAEKRAKKAKKQQTKRAKKAAAAAAARKAPRQGRPASPRSKELGEVCWEYVLAATQRAEATAAASAVETAHLADCGDPVAQFVVEHGLDPSAVLTIRALSDLDICRLLNEGALSGDDKPAALRSRIRELQAGGGLMRCCYALQGRCRFGPKCRFAHTRRPGAAWGPCQFGNACRVGHWEEPGGVHAQGPEAQLASPPGIWHVLAPARDDPYGEDPYDQLGATGETRARTPATATNP